ncbi:Cys-tRNA(Pro) deacylase [Anaerosphaera multitolerans]|uniref:Cys-tRNA(Pro)/Cys-tRNA(Cys) deacylase n=1 Tax=Anaerosphaera multitolerans TaxID=2487351 RepID=A0A437S719_9FIRM|nr:Cys-tRNA(Pro) deacylase [Anaerosphaera multitolerans]RVU54825.1 Cys-tRNA(Pro) deacylase [Anaerosphaera multitolerans]
MKKTNAMRILENKGIDYEIIEYSPKGGISGVEVAATLKEDENLVFKTLVTQSKDDHYVFVVPVARELDLKKAAASSKEKKIEMIPQRELLGLTGYVHGGCSPVGMKKQFKTFIDLSAKDLNYFYISGGKIGMQIKISPLDLKSLIDAEFYDLVKDDLDEL